MNPKETPRSQEMGAGEKEALESFVEKWREWKNAREDIKKMEKVLNAVPPLFETKKQKEKRQNFLEEEQEKVHRLGEEADALAKKYFQLKYSRLRGKNVDENTVGLDVFGGGSIEEIQEDYRKLTGKSLED